MILGLLFLLSSAQAEERMVLDWSKGPVRYHLESLVDTPRTMIHQSSQNKEARAVRQLIVGDVTCSGQPKGKRWSVDCTVDKVSFQGVAIPGDEAALTEIMADYQARLQGKIVQLSMTSDGRIVSLALVGVEKSDKRTGVIVDTIRMLMRRLFAPLDLQLPKNGDSKGSAWKQKGAPLSLELLTRFGTAGGTRLEHQVDGTSLPGIQISSTGRGSVSPGEALEAGTSSMMKIETTGSGYFDPALGLVSWREIQTSARFTVSAHSAGMGGQDYSHKGFVARILDNGRQVQPGAVKPP